MIEYFIFNVKVYLIESFVGSRFKILMTCSVYYNRCSNRFALYNILSTMESSINPVQDARLSSITQYLPFFYFHLTKKGWEHRGCNSYLLP